MLLVLIEVRPSRIHGTGVFAAAPIGAGTIVWQFDPGVDHRHPVAWLKSQPPHVQAHFGTYGVLSLDRQSIYLAGDPTIFINHSPTPNLAPKDDLLRNDEGVVVAARDIAPGEELTVNYGEIDGGDRDKLAQGRPLF
jgi:SET domain-containing protein